MLEDADPTGTEARECMLTTNDTNRKRQRGAGGIYGEGQI
jgi:hypothetical protein